MNNAATLLMPTPTADITEGQLRDVFAVNVFAPLLLTGILAPQMARSGGGVIVNIGSITGLLGASGSAVYCANKAAIHSLTKSWADEYGPVGVRVNAMAPGPIATERQQEYAEHLEPVLARLPSRRMSTPEGSRRLCGLSRQRRRQQCPWCRPQRRRRLVGDLRNATLEKAPNLIASGRVEVAVR
ncbi:hypothetical protein TUM20984_29450 [Mycobacterium antarcticum]|nr:hypothetical protein TUM20984_29450 [Mycolicibacterium sp. TUM20984]